MKFWLINRIDENGNHICGYIEVYDCSVYSKEEAVENYEYYYFTFCEEEPFLYEVELIEE